MDANGLLVAASEVVRFDKGKAIILTFYNENMDFHFYMLNVNTETIKELHINNYYKFTNLKIGSLEMVSGKIKKLLKTTEDSLYFRIDKHYEKKFKINTCLKEIISVPGIWDSFKVGNKCESALISYKGEVTDIKSSYGVYELDCKVILYTVYNTARSILSQIRKGSELFISNVHLINISKNSSILVCCGLSSIRVVTPSLVQDENKVCVDNFPLINLLSIYDILWIEKLFERLRQKFFTLIPSKYISIDNNKEFLENAVNFFQRSITVPEKIFSIPEEYCSYPHNCLPFSEDLLDTGSDIHAIQDILKETSNRLSWIEISKQWSISIHLDMPKVLIGIFYLSDKNCYYIQDNSACIPILLIEHSSSCCQLDNTILKHFKTIDTAIIVAIQDYDLLYENVKYKSKNQECLVFFRTSPCCIIPLSTFDRLQRSVSSLSVEFQKKLKINDKRTFKSSESKNANLIIPSEDIPIESCQKTELQFLVLNKVWLKHDDILKCCRVLISTLPQNDTIKNDSMSIFNNTFNFYDTEDDFEFANLVDKIDCFTNNAPRLFYLCFKSEAECKFLLSRHIYCMDVTDFLAIQNVGNALQINQEDIFLLEITENVKIHYSSCYWNEDYLDFIKYYGIKEILTCKRLPKNSYIRAVLVDKFYENDVRNTKHCRSNSKQGSVICLLLRDINSCDTIYAYLPLLPNKAVGFLPGAILELYGFFCICSQKGYYYLKASSMFGIEVRSLGKSVRQSSAYEEAMVEGQNQVYKDIWSFRRTLKQICFLIKIIDAELNLFCKKCLKQYQEKCSCLVSYKVKTTVRALIDDGRIQLLCHFGDDKARQILALDKKEWFSLISHVEQTQRPMKFNDKMNPKDIAYLPIINQVFCTYCLSKSTCRQMLIEYYIFPNSAPSVTNVDNLYLAWCVDIFKVDVKECMMELYIKLKNINNV